MRLLRVFKIRNPLALIIALLLLCTPVKADDLPRTAKPTQTVPVGATPLQSPFAIGVEYIASSGMSSSFGGIGVKWAKTAAVEWNQVEPRPPIHGVSHYQFEKLDSLVREWQQSGVQNIQVWISCNADWATKPVPVLAGRASRVSSPPKNPEMLKAYGKFVHALVSRYRTQRTGSSIALNFPVLHFEIESSAQSRSHWNGTSAEYLTLLRTAHAAVKRANPAASVIASGMSFEDLFDDLPSDLEITKRRGVATELDQQMKFNEAILKHPELFDVVEFHYLGDYLGAYGATRWIRSAMPEPARARKKIWAGDTYSAPVFRFGANNFNPIVGKDEATRLLSSLRDVVTPTKTNEVEQWFRRKQASLLVKKVIVGMHSGLSGLNVGNTSDWLPYLNPTNGVSEDLRLYQENSAYMGLMEFSAILNSTLGEPRPVYKALVQCLLKVPFATSVTRVAAPNGVFAYRLEGPGSPYYVAWYESTPYSLPDMPGFRIGMRGKIGGKMATVLPIIPEEGLTGPRYLPVEAGRIPLSENPVWIQGITDLNFDAR